MHRTGTATSARAAARSKSAAGTRCPERKRRTGGPHRAPAGNRGSGPAQVLQGKQNFRLRLNTPCKCLDRNLSSANPGRNGEVDLIEPRARQSHEARRHDRVIDIQIDRVIDRRGAGDVQPGQVEADIDRLAPQIAQQAVVAHAMPLGNATDMTETERAAIGAWIEAGARGP